MPSLAELTDYYPQASTDLPVEPLYLPNVNTNDVSLSTGEGVPTRITVRPEPRPEPIPEHITRSAIDKLLGIGGERYQLWPEKILREGATAAGKVLAGEVPQWSIDKGTGEVHTSPQMIEKAQEISALAGTGGLAGADATLGATPFLRPALKYKDKLYKGKEGQQHMDVIPKELYPEFEQMAMSGEDISHYNFGFVNEKGHFLNREKALEHAINNGLIDPVAGQYGALTSTLMADSSKPGVAIEAIAKTASPFYSALEHNVGNISQNKMTGEQWLGTLSNKPGVKPEEMQWTGLQEFLQSKSKEPVTKEQIQEHLQNNKIELREVSKGAIHNDPVASYLHKIDIAKEIRTSDDIANAKSFNSNFKETVKGLSDEEILKSARKAEDYKNIDPNTKYHGYQLPGGENYREMLLTLPSDIPKFQATQKANDLRIKELRDSMHGTSGSNEIRTEISKLQNENQNIQKQIRETNLYKSSHWDEPNILAHVRMNDRTIDGKKSLHLEEIQSDWHQQGRDKGYKGNDIYETKRNELSKKMEAIRSKAPDDPNDGLAQLKWLEQQPEYVKLRREFNSLVPTPQESGGKVPDAPFKKSWHELALKRMIREAAEKGYDRLSWTPGEAQAARYDLSKSIENVRYYGDKRLVAFDKNDRKVIDKEVSAKELPDIIGKEAADKLIKAERKKVNDAYSVGMNLRDVQELKNADLKIGGEGMKGFYDQIIPKALEKIGKEHGVKVKTYEQLGKLSNKMDKPPETVKIHYIDIPQSFKDQAMHKGFPLFSKGGHMLMPVDHEPDFGDK